MTELGATQRRAVSYIRESSEEQGKGFSPEAQRQGIQRFAAENDLNLVKEYCDFQSGWKDSGGRAEFQRLMTDAAHGNFEVVLVFHTSRFARNQADSRRYKSLLRQTLGVSVISVTQPMGEDPNEPSSFLNESINEVFDEYYSVCLAFWTRAGLHEKARQGNLVGSLPWGLLRLPDGGVGLDDHRSPLVLAMFERYAEGGTSDRQLAVWLNSQGALTSKGNPFSKDTVREMLVNAAYAGYVTARRDKQQTIKGNHPAIVPWDLFQRVQEVRAQRTTTRHPGRPSVGYALSKLLTCGLCGGRMHGSTGGRKGTRRYICSTRKQSGSCQQPVVPADEIEEAVAEFVRAFDPPHAVRLAVVRRLKQAGRSDTEESDRARRSELTSQLERLKDLYLMGDLTKDQYTFKRQVLQGELESLQPAQITDVTQAAAALTNFGLFWERETDRGERNKLLRLILQQVTVLHGRLAGVVPRQAFFPYFQIGREEAGWEIRERRDSNPRPPA